VKLLIGTALAVMLASPALAEKTPTKPALTCQDQVMLKQMIYHLNAIDMMIEEMRADALRQYPKELPKK
jgi:hypothetical protein